MEDFLRSTDVIDWMHPLIRSKAQELASGVEGAENVAKRCFEFVRDEIQHSHDFKRDTLACSASEVLAERTGWCYAKSHLLAALLRANDIPSGFCYQRLSNDAKAASFCLHGLNAVYLPQYGWYRVDPRGNRADVDAQFTPPLERLAFRAQTGDEWDFPEILADPLPCVIDALRTHRTWEAMYRNLPDWTEHSLPGSFAKQ